MVHLWSTIGGFEVFGRRGMSANRRQPEESGIEEEQKDSRGQPRYEEVEWVASEEEEHASKDDERYGEVGSPDTSYPSHMDPDARGQSHVDPPDACGPSHHETWLVSVSTSHRASIRTSLQQTLTCQCVPNPRNNLPHNRNKPLEPCTRWHCITMPYEFVAFPRARIIVCRKEAADAARPAGRLVLHDIPGLRPEVTQGRSYGGRAHLHGITAGTSAVLWSLVRDHDV